ncbi:MAG: CopD family protein, partial [Actinomycetota bacterium]
DPTTQLGALGVPALAAAVTGITRTVGDGALVATIGGAIQAVALAIWIGGVVLVARVVLTGPGEEDLVHAVRGFSRVSLGAIVVSVVSGLVLLIQLGGGGLFSSGYGRVLLLQWVVIAAGVFLAISARQVVGQRLARAQELGVREADRLRRAFGAEAGIGILIIATSSWVLAFTPPWIDDSPRIPYEVETRIDVEVGGQEALDVIIRLTDDQVGLIGMEVDVRGPDEGLSNLRVVFTAPPNGLNVGQIVQPVPLTGPGVAVRLEANGLPFAVAGDWTLQITATTSLGPVESEALPFRVFNADGTEATTTLPVPQANTVPLVTTTTVAVTDG